MTSTSVLVLLGLGLSVGALLVAGHGMDPRRAMTPRERAIEAQRLAEKTARIARELTARAEET